MTKIENTLFKMELTKPLEKLLALVGNAIGTFYKPTAIRREAEARAFEIEIIERAKSKALVEGREAEADSLIKIQDKFLHRESKRLDNTNNVLQIAAEQLNQEKEVSNEEVYEDWATRFFNIVEDVSDHEMQKLWGRILAGEVKQPNSYSIRTLELLKNLSKDEAEIFTKFAQHAIITGDNYFILDPDKGAFIKEVFNITFSDRMILSNAGLINTIDTLEITYPATEDRNLTTVIRNGEMGFFIERKAGTPKHKVLAISFSKSGSELLKLIPPVINDRYVQKIISVFKDSKTTLVKYGKIVPIEGELIKLDKIKVF